MIIRKVKEVMEIHEDPLKDYVAVWQDGDYATEQGVRLGKLIASFSKEGIVSENIVFEII